MFYFSKLRGINAYAVVFLRDFLKKGNGIREYSTLHTRGFVICGGWVGWGLWVYTILSQSSIASLENYLWHDLRSGLTKTDCRKSGKCTSALPILLPRSSRKAAWNWTQNDVVWDGVTIKTPRIGGYCRGIAKMAYEFVMWKKESYIRVIL